MNKRRLLKLADLLEADAKNKKGVKFDLHTFAKPADDTRVVGGYEKRANKSVPVDCSTAACALGLACLSGAFKRGGLTYTFRHRNFYFEGGGSAWQLVPKYKTYTDFRAAERFFGITVSDAKFLFSAGEYPEDMRQGAKGERYVARRIRKFVAGEVAP